MLQAGTAALSHPLLVRFCGGSSGSWSVLKSAGVVGPALPAAPFVDVVPGGSVTDEPASAAWSLRGVVSNERYVERPERERLVGVQAALGREGSTRAALIPIRKSPAWWSLTQDERRAIFEDRSRHIALAIEYLPRIARRLHHSRDLGERYDFLTWFDYAPADAEVFEELVGRLRETEEWTYVDAEADVRLAR